MRYHVDKTGEELKVFDVKDGFGLMLWKRAGLKSAIVTAKNEGLKGSLAKVRIRELLQNPTNQMITEAIDSAEYATFQNLINFTHGLNHDFLKHAQNNQ